jgi:hypothetical protein
VNQPQPRLAELLGGAGLGDLSAQYASTEAAAERELLPPGKYLCRVARGELGKASTGTPRYLLRFEVIEGPHAGRFIYHDVWLTPAALPQAKRDLAKLGVQALSQLESPVPPGIVCEVAVVIRSSDGGDQRNSVRRFDFIRRDEDAMDDPDFAPPAPPAADTAGGEAPPAKGGG